MKEQLSGDILTAWIQRGLILIVAIMPFHAFLSVWLGHIVGHQAVWQSWKEVVILVLVGLSLELVRQQPDRLRRLANPFNYLLVAFVVIAILVTLPQLHSPTTALFGLKTDVEFLVIALIAQLVGDTKLIRRLLITLLITTGLVVVFGLAQIFLLPKDWLMQFGYGPTTLAPYNLVDPAVDSIRIASTLGGTNQLGWFLILPICVLVWHLLQPFAKQHVLQALLLVATLIVLWHTYGRAALLGLVAALLLVAVLRLPKRWRIGVFASGIILSALTIALLLANMQRFPKLQYYLLHQGTAKTGFRASTDQHLSQFQEGVQVALKHPLGQGLGSAGPASFRGNHPLIPESYYLQIAIETGVLGLLLFVGLQIAAGLKLWKVAATTAATTSTRMAAVAACAALVGIGVVNLFLHGWSDSSTALVYWSLAGAVIGSTT